MPLLKPDATFYPSPRLAAQGPPEKLAYVAALNPPGSKNNDAIIVVDLDPASSTYCQEVGRCTLPNFGDELHHFGWNACSSALCPYAPHPHYRTALPYRARDSFVAALRYRHQTQSA
jgi:selenium-binding protein 1